MAQEYMAQYAHEVLRQENEAIEQACERMLTSNTYGVLVLTDPVTKRMHHVGLHPDVPYGAIYYREEPDVPR